MNLTLKAANGKFVCAEEGGGIDTRQRGEPVAVRANRDVAGPWETFALEYVGSSHVALKTSGGYYITAEGGGGGDLRTNETSVGPWETFLPVGVREHLYGFKTWNGHFLCAEIGVGDPVVNATRTQQGPWETFQTQAFRPSPDIKHWKGAIVIPDALPGIPYGDGRRIWTAAYGCYNDNWRAQIRQAYAQRGYTHFVYNCAGLPYAGDYPELADDPMRVERDLNELIGDDLVPVVCATDDRNRNLIPVASFLANAALIRVCFPMWEMNGVLDNDTAAMKGLIQATRAAAPQADCYLHFTPGHGSIDQDEAGGWRWCQEHGVTGLLAQGSNRFPPGDPVREGEGLESTAIRLAGRVDIGAPPSWAGLHLLTVKFEYGVYDAYHGHVRESDQRDYTSLFLPHAPHVSGYGDGGR